MPSPEPLGTNLLYMNNLSNVQHDNPPGVFYHYTSETEPKWRITVREVSRDYRVGNDGRVPSNLELKLPVTTLSSITFVPRCDFDRSNFIEFRILKDKVGCADWKRIDDRIANVGTFIGW